EGAYEVAMMQMARAVLLMTLGRLKEGFDAYEVRLDPAMPDAMRVASSQPRWEPGADLAGKRVLVVGEQGIADEMVFSNILPDLADAIGPSGQLYLAVES